MAKTIHDLPQTKGFYQARGIVSGTQSEKFYTNKITENGNPSRRVSFQLEYGVGSKIYPSLGGMPKKSVWFYKKAEGSSKSETREIPWDNRYTFLEKGFSLIGVKVGLSKKKDDKGKEVNDTRMLAEYDACECISEKMKDGMSVFTKGNLKFSKYEDKRRTNFVPTQISLCKDVDFSEDDFVPMSNFTQTIVFTGIELNESKKEATIHAMIVNYNSIEDVDFYTKNLSLAKTMKKGIKPYTSIKVWGDIVTETSVDMVEESNCWGEENKMEVVNQPTEIKLYITGADPETIDEETYSEENIDAAIEAIKRDKMAETDYGEQWGKLNTYGDSDNDDDDELEGWV